MLRLVSILTLVGCSFEVPDADVSIVGPEPLIAPEVVSMARSELRIGETLTFTGYDFLDSTEGHVDVTFRGMFSPYGERPVGVNVTMTMSSSDGELQTRFGPFAVPFTRAGNRAGIFSGQVFAENRHLDGRVRRQVEASWPEVELQVLPSVIVRALRPRGESSLDVGPPDVLAQLPYVLEVEAVSFTPRVFEFRLGDGVLVGGEHQDVFTVDAIGPVQKLGEEAQLSFADVPQAVDRYPATIIVYALSTTGETISLDLPLIVHRTIQ